MSVIDYRHELEIISQDIMPEDQSIHPAVLELSALSLRDIDIEFGELSDNPLSQHNATHSLDVPRRAVHLTNHLHPFIEEKYRPQIFSLGMHIGSVHDRFQGKGLPGQNERASADYGVKCVRERGYEEVLGDWYIERFCEGVMVTSYRIDKFGGVEQYNLRVGKPDPIKFIMAFADINGIAMEGPERMIMDATNIYCERTKNPSVLGYLEWIENQAKFLSSRVNDPRIKQDIEYYFPDHQDEVYEVMHEQFHENIVSAHSLAKVIPNIKGVEAVVSEFIHHGFNPMTVGSKAVELQSKLK